MGDQTRSRRPGRPGQEEVLTIPSYSYLCGSCRHAFDQFKSIAAPHPAECPRCGEPYGRAFQQDYAQFRVTGTVYGDPKTVGQQAELNAKRLGGEQTQLLWEREQTRLSGYTGPLPPGAKPITGEAVTPPWRDGSWGTKPLDKPLDLGAVKNTTKYIETGES